MEQLKPYLQMALEKGVTDAVVVETSKSLYRGVGQDEMPHRF